MVILLQCGQSVISNTLSHVLYFAGSAAEWADSLKLNAPLPYTSSPQNYYVLCRPTVWTQTFDSSFGHKVPEGDASYNKFQKESFTPRVLLPLCLSLNSLTFESFWHLQLSRGCRCHIHLEITLHVTQMAQPFFHRKTKFCFLGFFFGMLWHPSHTQATAAPAISASANGLFDLPIYLKSRWMRDETATM